MTGDQSGSVIKKKMCRTLLWFIIAILAYTFSGFAAGYFFIEEVKAEINIPVILFYLCLALVTATWVGWPFAIYRYHHQKFPLLATVKIPMFFGILFGPALLFLGLGVKENFEITNAELLASFIFGATAGPFMMALSSMFVLFGYHLAFRGKFRKNDQT